MPTENRSRLKSHLAFFDSSYARLLLALVCALTGYILLSSYFVDSYSERMNALRRQELERLVELGLNAVQPIRERQANGELSAPEARAAGVDLIRRMTYSDIFGENYLFMSSYDGTMLVQPFEPELESTDQWALQDAEGKFIIQELIRTATSPAGRGYVEYYYPSPDETAPQRKLSYVVGIPEWNAYVGTGMYLDDIAAENRIYLLTTILLTTALGLLVGAIAALTLRPVIASQRVLLQLFQQIRRDPHASPPVPIERFRPGSEGRQLLAGFRDVLQEIRRSHDELQKSEERFDLAVQAANDAIWDWDLRTNTVYYSPRWKEMLGYAEEELTDRIDEWKSRQHPDDTERAMAAVEAHLQGDTALYQLEHRLRHKDGSYRWVLARGLAVRDAQGRPYRLVGSQTDMTERRRGEEIQAAQQHFLELLATDAPLSETLNRLLVVLEEQFPGMLGLVLFLDEGGRNLHVAAGPSLPQDYLDSIEGLEIGPMVGSCGTASYMRERVIVTDIAVDPRWDNLRELALASGLRACWSEPILSATGGVLGTFAMYYREPRSPTEAELQMIATGAHLVRVALQRKRADEARRESERRLSTLMSNLPGIAYRCPNEPGWPMEFVSRGSLELTGYPDSALAGEGALPYDRLIHAEDREMVWREIQAALDEKQPFQLNYRILTASGEEKWVWEQGRGVYDDDGGLVALEGFISDITERVTARQMLEQRVTERTQELSTLLDVAHHVASTLALEPLLGVILDQLKEVVDYDGASVLVLDDETLRVMAYQGPIPQEEALQIQFALAHAGANRTVIEERRPIHIPDVRADTAQGHAFQETAGAQLDTTFDYVRSWLGVPLIVKGEVLGMLSLDHRQPGYYADQHSRLALAFAHQVGVMIENARLFAELERRTRDLDALYRADEELYRHLDLDHLLQALVEVAVDLLHADKSAIMAWDEHHQELQVRAARGFREESLAQMHCGPGEGIVGQVALTGQAIAVANAAQDERVLRRVVDPEGIASFIHLPLKLNGDVFGVFNLSFCRSRSFGEEERRLFAALAQRAALAIENARLYQRAQDAAAAEERTRLARELHDAVTQTLFSASLIAEVLPRIWERDPAQGRARLEELRELARGALAEMRTLLLELRPAALTESSLCDLLRQLTEAVVGRSRLKVHLEIEGEGALPPDVQVALYRIAQESLNNVGKHAQANEVVVQLCFAPEEVTLSIRDDGEGFDPGAVPAESLGLGIMRERSARIGARLDVQSRPGRGTTVVVSWPTNAGDRS